MKLRLPLVVRFTALCAALLALGIALTLGLLKLWPQAPHWVGLGVFALMLPLALALFHQQLQGMLALFSALSGTVLSYRDGDFVSSFHWPRNDELSDLVNAHNELGVVLRSQRLDLVQRELLLDTMLQNTPVAMVLLLEDGPIVFANIAARKLLNQGRKLEGLTLPALLEQLTPALGEALAKEGDGLFSVRSAAAGEPEHVDEDDEIYHLSRRNFTLNGRRHELLLLRHLTTELRRQEVQTWKKVIRVISHELNNSLAPVASLANSAGELVKRGKYERLPQILQTIEERTRHLESFILGYARFAKLPTPRLESTHWQPFIARLQAQVVFTIVGNLPEAPVSFDIAQMEQALLNVLKNAHESGSPPEQVCLSLRRVPGAIRLEVMDGGSGMNDAVMANALVPFYSTKRSGTGLGLALTREIIEAHGGRIMLQNKASSGGNTGVVVSLILPTD
jgi:two-component system, NtrC family, nitrogen regulation sensor histidine kinase NtrY